MEVELLLPVHTYRTLFLWSLPGFESQVILVFTSFFLLFRKFCKIYITLFYTPLKMNIHSTFSFNALLLLLSCISKIIASYDLICHCVMVIKFISRGYWIAYGYKRNPSNILFAQLILSYCVKFMWVSLNIWVAFSIWCVPFPN